MFIQNFSADQRSYNYHFASLVPCPCFASRHKALVREPGNQAAFKIVAASLQDRSG